MFALGVLSAGLGDEGGDRSEDGCRGDQGKARRLALVT